MMHQINEAMSILREIVALLREIKEKLNADEQSD